MARIRDGIKLPCAVQKMNMVLECQMPLDGIEKLTVSELAAVYPELLPKAAVSNPETAFLLKNADDIAEGLRRMAEYDFESFWRRHFYDILLGVCEEYTKYAEKYDLARLFDDVNVIRQIEKIDNIRVYVSFFSSGISFMLNACSYVQGYWAEHPTTPEKLVCTLAHELCHGFINGELKSLYKNAYTNDPFLRHTHWFMINCCGSTDEEEFVVAIENYIAVRNGIRTLEQAREDVGIRYLSCMPISVILFDLLCKENPIPKDINGWFINCFESGYINIGEIKVQAEALYGGFGANFYETWNNDEYVSADKRAKYEALTKTE
jgi:hypothetical protein